LFPSGYFNFMTRMLVWWYFNEQLSQKARTLVWIQGLGRRVRALLEEAPQPREWGRN